MTVALGLSSTLAAAGHPRRTLSCSTFTPRGPITQVRRYLDWGSMTATPSSPGWHEVDGDPLHRLYWDGTRWIARARFSDGQWHQEPLPPSYPPSPPYPAAGHYQWPQIAAVPGTERQLSAGYELRVGGGSNPPADRDCSMLVARSAAIAARARQKAVCAVLECGGIDSVGRDDRVAHDDIQWEYVRGSTCPRDCAFCRATSRAHVQASREC